MNEKLCPKCGIVKPAEEWGHRRDRPGGFAYSCLECRYAAVGTGRRTLRKAKTCFNCARELPRNMFEYNQKTEDSLTEECRTCRLFKPGRPNSQQVEGFENALDGLIASAKRRFDPVGERVLFEEFVYKQFHLSGLDEQWKPPVWINKKLFKDG